MHARSLFWLLATSISIASALPATIYPDLESRSLENIGQLSKRTVCQKKSSGTHKRTGTTVCVATYGEEKVTIIGEKVRDTRGGGALYKVTEASCLPKGRYLVKHGLGPLELELSEAMGIAIAHNNPSKGTAVKAADQCIVMPVVGLHPKNLASYKEAHTTLAKCRIWVQARLRVVDAKVTEMRQKVGNFAHRDLCPENTRWKSDNEVVFIDFGEACALPAGWDPNGEDILQKTWIGELCEGPDTGKEVPELVVPQINAGIFGF
ncbi:hypothetical protein FRC14_005882 [Serendipita sp. 396]|nr:hypothetical protein FRC14_005882 [Serendipita sp. 396]KAG8777350.1 hypothetical protein FRC15_011391 [Serendipita sp. 397]KAG8794191.1 hypothetical protein FRC16_010664 [Serendipita sp. 398]KAG8823816.1 hypothetical protein FRC19_003082 [Serendipita sp. 401]KAG8862501.1 hypothetical protein FRC20_011219 [Serendipita sp. 405]KAG9054759.1 hypothetical protein FS842_004225 [Serendipita sp. 407]